MRDPDDPMNFKDPAVSARFLAHIEEMNKAYSIFYANFAWFEWLDRQLEKALAAAVGVPVDRERVFEEAITNRMTMGTKSHRLSAALKVLGIYRENADLMKRIHKIVDKRNVMAHETVPLVSHDQHAHFNEPDLVTSSHLVALLTETSTLIHELSLLAERLTQLPAQSDDTPQDDDGSDAPSR